MLYFPRRSNLTRHPGIEALDYRQEWVTRSIERARVHDLFGGPSGSRRRPPLGEYCPPLCPQSTRSCATRLARPGRARAWSAPLTRSVPLGRTASSRCGPTFPDPAGFPRRRPVSPVRRAKRRCLAAGSRTPRPRYGQKDHSAAAENSPTDRMR